jgi:hypothetical protein
LERICEYITSESLPCGNWSENVNGSIDSHKKVMNYSCWITRKQDIIFTGSGVIHTSSYRWN